MLSLLAGGLEQRSRAEHEGAMRNCKTALVVANEDRRHAIPRSEVLTRGAPRRKVGRNQPKEASWRGGLMRGGGGGGGIVVTVTVTVTVKRIAGQHDSGNTVG